MISRNQSGPGYRQRWAFTLIELLVVIAIITVLVGLMLPAIQRALLSTDRLKCGNNMRNLGQALHQYTLDNRGRFPPIVTTTNPLNDPTRAWVALLKPGVENNLRIFMCPNDPQAADRVANGGASYVFNNFLTSEVAAADGGVRLVADVTNPSMVMTFFPIADIRGTSPFEDHVHANNWFRTPGGAWFRLLADITPDRFGGNTNNPDRNTGVSNYAFVDTHIEVITAQGLKERCDMNDSSFVKAK